MLTFDLRAFERAARDMQAAADQVPFALSQSLNVAAEITRTTLAEETWPQAVSVRNPRFMKAALSTQGKRATKRNLSVTIFDRLGRASLLLHAEGGTKKPRRANLAVPTGIVKARRSGRGVPKGLRPANLPDSGPQEAFRKGDAIYQRVGAGRERHLRMLYVLTPQAPIKPNVPFEPDFQRTMTRQTWLAFGPRLQAAMMSRRVR